MSYAKWRYKVDVVELTDLAAYLNLQEENGFEVFAIHSHTEELVTVVTRKSTRNVTTKYIADPLEGFR